MSIESVMPSNHLILCRPLPPPAFNLSQHQSLIQLVSSLHQVDNVLELQLQHQSFQWIFRVDFLYDLKILVWSPCCPRDSQESSPAPQFESINSLELSFLCGPTLTSIHDYWKKHSFDYMDFCWQSAVSYTMSRFSGEGMDIVRKLSKEEPGGPYSTFQSQAHGRENSVGWRTGFN